MQHPLIGKAVRFTRTGTYCGTVRKVTMTKATKKKPAAIKTLIVQRVGGPTAVTGKSYSAKCGGERVRITPDCLVGVSWFGKMRPLTQFLEKAGIL